MLLLQWPDSPAERAGIRGKELPNTPRAENGSPDWDMHRVTTLERGVKEDLGSGFPFGDRYQENLVFLEV